MLRSIFTCGLAGLFLLLVPSHAAAGRRDAGLTVTTSAGFDSNPLQLSESLEGGPFAQLSLDARFNDQFSKRVGYFMSAGARSRFHDSDLDDADVTQADAQAGMGFILTERGETRLSLAVGGGFALERSTFIDPVTGEAYEFSVDPNTFVPIPDRFSANVTRGFANLRLRLSDGLLLMLDSELARTDYTHDYEVVPGMEPLDDRSWRVRPGLSWRVGSKVRLDATFDWGHRSYDELSAVDESAVSVSGSQRAYRSAGSRLTVTVAPARNLDVSVGVLAADQADLQAGYYDSLATGGFVALAGAVTPTLRLTLSASQMTFDYDNATVPNDPTGVRLSSGAFRAAGRIEKSFGRHLMLFGELGTDRESNNDPIYAYQRNFAFTGLRFAL